MALPSLSSVTTFRFLLVTALMMVPSFAVSHDASNISMSTATTNNNDNNSHKTQPFKVAMIPKFDGLVVFDQAFSGAYSAFEELHGSSSTTEEDDDDDDVLEYVAPPDATGSGASQIDIITSASLQNFNVVLLSNNAQDDIVRATRPAKQNTGLVTITWDSPIPLGYVHGAEELFVSQVDFDDTGQVLADMVLQQAIRLLDDKDGGDSVVDDGNGHDDDGDAAAEGGEFAILSASDKAANQNAWIDAMMSIMHNDVETYGQLQLVELVYGDDDDTISYQRTLDLLDAHPNLDVIVSPTTVGMAAAARAVSDRDQCSTVKVVGLGLPAEMVDYTLSGCAPVFALWSFVDLGYLSYYAAYRLVKDRAFVVEPGASFDAGRLGTFTVERDPTRPDVVAYRIIMGGFTLYDKDNVEEAVYYDAIQGDGGQESFEERFIDKFKKKAIAIIPKVTGMISFVASGYIVWNIVSIPRRRNMTKFRLLVGISIHDMIASLFGFVLSTWPIPADTWLVWGNVGTTQSCTMQGFFFQAGIGAGPLYSAALTTLYLLNIVFEVSTDTIVRKWEPLLHAIPIAFGWGTAIAGLPLTLYNSADRVLFMCWIAEYPAFCSLRDRCERGANAEVYRWAFLYSWVFAVFVYMTFVMCWIYHKVLSVEKATDRWTTASGQRRRRNQSRRVAAQGLQYVLAFIFPWVFGITVSIMLNHVYGDLSATAQLIHALTVLEVVNAVVWPLKGFFTFLAYMRPHRKKNRVRSEAGKSSTASSQQRRSSDVSSQAASVGSGDEPGRGRRLLRMTFNSLLWSRSKREQRQCATSVTASVQTLAQSGNDNVLLACDDHKTPGGEEDALGVGVICCIEEETSCQLHSAVTMVEGEEDAAALEATEVDQP